MSQTEHRAADIKARLTNDMKITLQAYGHDENEPNYQVMLDCLVADAMFQIDILLSEVTW